MLVYSLEPVKKLEWSDDAVRDLISVWGKIYAESNEERQKRGLQEVKLSSMKYEGISNALHELGYNFTKYQCRMKVSTLLRHYKRVCYDLSLVIFGNVTKA